MRKLRPISTLILAAMSMLLGPAVAAVAQQTEPPAAAAPAEAPDYINWHWRMMQDGWHAGFGYGHWFFSLLFWLLLIGALLLAVWAVTSRPASRTPSPRDILDERYARGEIDRDEYRRRRADLNGTDSSS